MNLFFQKLDEYDLKELLGRFILIKNSSLPATVTANFRMNRQIGEFLLAFVTWREGQCIEVIGFYNIHNEIARVDLDLRLELERSTWTDIELMPLQKHEQHLNEPWYQQCVFSFLDQKNYVLRALAADNINYPECNSAWQKIEVNTIPNIHLARLLCSSCCFTQDLWTGYTLHSMQENNRRRQEIADGLWGLDMYRFFLLSKTPRMFEGRQIVLCEECHKWEERLALKLINERGAIIAYLPSCSRCGAKTKVYDITLEVAAGSQKLTCPLCYANLDSVNQAASQMNLSQVVREDFYRLSLADYKRYKKGS